MPTIQRLFAVIMLCLLTACGSSSPTTNLPVLQGDAVILAFGDSLTYGTGAKLEDSYPAQLANQIQRKVINAGVPGETTAGGLKRLPGVALSSKPDLVLLCLGANDFLRRHDPKQTISNLNAMLDWLKHEDIPVVLISVPGFGIGLTGSLKSAELYRQIAEQRDLVLEDRIMAEVISQRELKSDRVHPNAQGYRQIAAALAELLQQQGVIPKQ